MRLITWNVVSALSPRCCPLTRADCSPCLPSPARPEWHQAARPLPPVSLEGTQGTYMHSTDMTKLTCGRDVHRWNQKRTYEGIMEDLGGDIICIQGQREPSVAR